MQRACWLAQILGSKTQLYIEPIQLKFLVLDMILTHVLYVYNRIMPTIYDELKPLTILDPLLLYGFMYICPKKELPGLFAKVHPFFSMSLLSKSLKDNRVIDLKEVDYYNIICQHKTVVSNKILSTTSYIGLVYSTFFAYVEYCMFSLHEALSFCSILSTTLCFSMITKIDRGGVTLL